MFWSRNKVGNQSATACNDNTSTDPGTGDRQVSGSQITELQPEGQLKVIRGQSSGKTFDIGTAPLCIGRSSQADIVLDDPSISRRHAIIAFEDGKYTVKDNGSNNGTFIRGQRITCEVVDFGDSISLGSTTLLLERTAGRSDCSSSLMIYDNDDSSPPAESIMINASDMGRLNDELRRKSAASTDMPPDKDKLKKLQAMIRVIDAISSIFSLDRLIEELMDVIFDEMNATRGFIMLYDDQGELKPVCVRKGNSSSENIAVSSTVIKTVTRNRTAILSSDLMSDQRFGQGQSIMANEMRSCMCSPLIYKDELLGIVHVDSDVQANAFSSSDLELLVSVSAQAALCIKNARLVRTVSEEENKRAKLSQYFPPAHVEMLMNDELDHALGGKRKAATVLFCDIRGFTRLSEDMDPSQVMDLLNDFFGVMTGIIFNNEGMVDNFMGDCIMAVFGDPFCLEQEHSHAVRSALEMQMAQRRGRDAGYPTPPAQIRTCGTTAYGSCLGCLA